MYIVVCTYVQCIREFKLFLITYTNFIVYLNNNLRKEQLYVGTQIIYFIIIIKLYIIYRITYGSYIDH